VIYGDRIRLRAIERSDIPTFIRWFNDPEVRRYLLINAPMGTIQEEAWLERAAKATDQYFFAIEAQVNDDWVHIGNTSLAKIDWTNRTCIFGLALGEKDYWGRGYGSAATRAMVGFALNELNLHRVELEVFAEHTAAIRCYTKSGFVMEGTRRAALYKDGRYHDAHIMAVVKED
jgi:diamine N-acetyltransferase